MLLKKFSRFRYLPVFLYLLPLFFVFHGYTENFGLIPAADCFRLLLKYYLITLAMHGLLFLLTRDGNRAAYYSFILLLVYFFFGAFHDFLKLHWQGTFLVKYVFLLPFIFFLLVTGVVLIYRKKELNRLTLYFNALFLLLIFLDVFFLVTKKDRYTKEKSLQSLNREFVLCDTCYKPDVYLIVADEYAGEKTLRDLYNFDNSPFLGLLRERRFQIIENSFSNYNITPISMASLLNLDCPGYAGKQLSDIDMIPVYNAIDTNILVPFFKYHGYEFFNNSVFTIDGQPPQAPESFIPVNAGILERQTLLSRLRHDLGFHLVNWNIIHLAEEDDYAVMHNNNKVIKTLKELVLDRGGRPRFIYSHLTMPHGPYYFNSKGEPYPLRDIVEGQQWRDDHYIEYLQYTNGVLINLLDFILKNSSDPPVIILISDHGFRYFSRKVREEYNFYNLNATFLPDKYGYRFRDGLSNLQYMKTLLNLLFNQRLKAEDKDQSRTYIPIPHKIGK